MIRYSVSSILMIWGTILSNAQVLSEGIPKGGGTFSDCDSSLVVDFTVEPLGGLQQLFTAVVDPGITNVIGTTWTYFTDQLQQQDGNTMTVTYPAPGEVPICLTASAFDMSLMEGCSNTTCRFVEIVQDPSCLAFEPDFTIASVQGNTIVFEQLSPGDSAFWTFGEGAAAANVSPVNTFDGPGPHKVCLTLIGPPPVNCSATICKWLYLGPGDVPCDQVVSPGFMHFQQDNFVVVLDTSIVTGQSSSIHWDFGDGATAEGPIAVHEYLNGWDQYQLCAEVDVWGPLVADTCIAQRCETIYLGAAISIDEMSSAELIVSPNPVADRLNIAGEQGSGSQIMIWDGMGRLVLEGTIVPGNDASIDVSGLRPGIHTLQHRYEGRTRSVRFVKL